MDLNLAWRGPVDNDQLNRLHAEGFGTRVFDWDWATQLERHSLGWVTAHHGLRLVGFVNVAWDGAVHAFLLDTLVAADLRRAGVGRRLVERAAEGARAAACEWLHVDWDDDYLTAFYLEGCGFVPTKAGLIAL
ncbi:MAG TPA: GNAT family N-acetyltransferase [Candidatus Limnocylindrales bacterium]|jgi:GNAT superfamily N-acetyltransferase